MMRYGGDRIERGFKELNDRIDRKLDRVFYVLVANNLMMAAVVILEVLEVLGD